MLKHLPNFITLVNLFCGGLSMTALFTGRFDLVPWFVLLGLMADYGDGLVARLLKASSPLGKELDSLADMVSFGLVPGTILLVLINKANGIESFDWEQNKIFWGFLGFVLTLFSALRLAKFNIDERQGQSFRGLNTPASTIFMLGLLLIQMENPYGLRELLIQPFLLYLITILFSYLLVADWPMFNFKFQHFGWKGNEWRWAYIISAIAIWIIEPLLAPSLMIVLYLLLSVFYNITNWQKAKRSSN